MFAAVPCGAASSTAWRPSRRCAWARRARPARRPPR